MNATVASSGGQAVNAAWLPPWLATQACKEREVHGLALWTVLARQVAGALVKNKRAVVRTTYRALEKAMQTRRGNVARAVSWLRGVGVLHVEINTERLGGGRFRRLPSTYVLALRSGPATSTAGLRPRELRAPRAKARYLHNRLRRGASMTSAARSLGISRPAAYRLVRARGLLTEHTSVLHSQTQAQYDQTLRKRRQTA